MICFLIGLMFLMQQPMDSEESGPSVPVLHDSLVTENSFLTAFTPAIFLTNINGWKFSPEDDPRFSSPDYDDSDWYTITKPFSDPSAVPDSLWNGFGWFRLTVEVDSTFSLIRSLIREQGGAGAHEIFINDSLIIKKGNPSPTPDDQILRSLYTYLGDYFEWVPGETYTIAIRASFHHYEMLNRFSLGRYETPHNIVLNFGAIDAMPDINSFIIGLAWIQGATITLILLVMLLHLALYFKAGRDPSNIWLFYISAFFFMYGMTFTSLESVYLDTIPIHVDVLGHFINGISVFAIVFIIPIATHKVLDIAPHKFWWYFVAFTPILIISAVINPQLFAGLHYPFHILAVFLLSIFGGLSAVYKARKRENRDLSIVTVSIVSIPIMFIGMGVFYVLGWQSALGFNFIVFILLITFPVGMSIFQSKRFLRLHNQMDMLVEERTSELQLAYDRLEKSMSDLKAAQNQLVQQEKLASLGQLTAGIAHEIKNPLNFVNNFSEVSDEMITELIEALNKGDIDESLALSKDIGANLRKIHEHGSRADGIVKSMLQHSRGGDGKMEPTDLNALVKEYVNLAFHGMRAGKDPINVDIQLELDENVGEVPLIAEDFSRVILNLCNNGFDALREKANVKRETTDQYEPKLRVRTKSENGKVQIEIEDNGSGIPDEIKDKILQPFFTTKKGTQGTGLGLSITNDIVKAHGGTLSIPESGETETTFRIELRSNQ